MNKIRIVQYGKTLQWFPTTAKKRLSDSAIRRAEGTAGALRACRLIESGYYDIELVVDGHVVDSAISIA